jgi:hypothetical protein
MSSTPAFDSERVNMKNFSLQMFKISGGLMAGLLVPTLAQACACGCGVFDVGTSYMIPNGPGGMVWAQYDYLDQNHNWHGSAEAPAQDNDDKKLVSNFASLNFQYLFNPNWGLEAELPYTFRYFRATLDDGAISSHSWSGLGDIRLQALYTGFSADLSSGLNFGVKLPTGGFHADSALVDRDTQIGAGSADLLLGGFHRDQIGRSVNWEWFSQLQLDVPTIIQENYRPGLELGAAGGVDYTGFSIGRARIIPLAQVIVSARTSDSGAAADPGNTGYERILLSPGLEVHIHPFDIYADAEFPVFQNFNGNQLAGPYLLKVAVSYMF